MSRLRIESKNEREPFDPTIIVIIAFAICSAMEFLYYSYNFNFGPGFIRTKNMIPFVIAILYGAVQGLVCLVPMTISEIVWVVVISKSGTELSPLLNMMSIIIVVGLLGWLSKRPFFKDRWIKVITFEIAIVAAYALMAVLHAIFKLVTVNVMYLFWSGANIVMAGVLLALSLIKTE